MNPPLKTSRGILSAKVKNPYTNEYISNKWLKEKNNKNRELKHKILPPNTKVYQKIDLRCSFQHVKTSLLKWGISFKIPKNIRKLEMEHSDINETNYIEKQPIWEPYLRNDILSLAACTLKYNTIMKNICHQSIQNNLTSSSLTFKAWFSQLKEEVHSHTDVFTRNYIRRSVKGGRVSANINKFKSSSINDIIDILKLHLKTEENDIVNLMEIYTKLIDCDSWNIINNIKNDLSKLKINDILMAFDATSLYPSAMFDENSEFPKAESARPITEEEKTDFVSLFNNQQFRPKTGIFGVYYEYPNNLFFQPVPAKDKINKIDLIRFRNGEIFDTLNSVDIQEIVRCGGKILKIYDGIVYEENYKISPFREYVEKLFNLRLKYKEEKNTVGSDLIKLLLNSLYGKTVQKDILTSNHLWNRKTLETNYCELIKNYEKVKNDLYYVEKEIEETEFKKSYTFMMKEKEYTNLMPSHLGSFILSHSRRIMNNFILTINGFKEPKIYYTDTDSIYIHKSNWNLLDKAGYVGDTLMKGKNDYGNGGIIYGLYIAPKIKYNIVIDNDFMLTEKTTFKGYNSDTLKVKDFLKLYNRETVTSKVKSPWKKSLEHGILIPDNEMMEKKFSANINILKRKAPDKNYLMHPYSSKTEVQKLNTDLNYNEILSQSFDPDYICVE